MVTHPSTNPARPDVTSELVCLPSLLLAKIILSNTTLLSLRFTTLSVFPLPSLCEGKGRTNIVFLVIINIEAFMVHTCFIILLIRNPHENYFYRVPCFNLVSATASLHLSRVHKNLCCFARLSHSKLTGPSIWFYKKKHNKFKLKYHVILNDTTVDYTMLHYTSLHYIVWSLNSGKLYE